MVAKVSDKYVFRMITVTTAGSQSNEELKLPFIIIAAWFVAGNVKTPVKSITMIDWAGMGVDTARSRKLFSLMTASANDGATIIESQVNRFVLENFDLT